jgi:O-antigen ligase
MVGNAIPITSSLNDMGLLIAICIIIAVMSLYLKVTFFPKFKPIYTVICIFIFLLGLIVTMSRSGIIVTLIGVLALFIYYKINLVKLLLISLFSILFYNFAPDAFKGRMQVSATLIETDDYGNENYADARTLKFSESIQEMQKHFMWGVGEGNYHLPQGDYYKVSPFVIYKEETDTYSVTGTHNILFQIIIQSGIIAAIIFIIIQIKIVTMLPNRNRQSLSDIFVFAINISSIIYIFLVHDWYSKVYSTAYGALLAAYTLRNKDEVEEDELAYE